MSHARYETAETLVYDPVASNRNATRATLRSLGFRRVEFVGSVPELRDVLAARPFDLLLCEAGGAEADVCKLIQSIRQGRLSANPFLVAIVTTWRRDGTIVQQAVNSGADDLIARPFSAVALGERLKAHVERRKGFIVTSDYIGPDRRRDDSRPGAPRIEVPNSLRMKAVLGLSAGEAEPRIAAAIVEGKRVIDAEKLRRDVVQVSAQRHVLESRKPGSRDFVAALSRIEELAADISRRAGSTGSPAIACCMALQDAARAAADALRHAPENPEALPATLDALGEAVAGLGQAFDLGDDSVTPLHNREARITRAEVPAVSAAHRAAVAADRIATAGVN